MRLSLYAHPDGGELDGGNRVVFDVARNQAYFGAARVDGRALVWEIGEGDPGSDALLSRTVELDPTMAFVARCDRVDFPPGAIAHTHTHPGPGIRCLLSGQLHVHTEGRSVSYGPGDAWFESGPEPVHATAGPVDTAFVRVLLLPAEWAGKRTIHYVDPADEDKPKLQRATILLDQPISLR